MCDCWMRVRLGHDALCTNTVAEREEMRQFNGATINQLCEMGCKLVDLYMADLRKQVVSAGDYNYAESLYLHGDLSGR